MPDYPKYDDAPPPPPPGAYPPGGYSYCSGLVPCPVPVGVGGFLLLICVLMTLVFPPISGICITQVYNEYYPQKYEFWLFNYYSIARPFVYAALAILSFLAGIALWTRRRHAVKIAMIYLSVSLLNVVVFGTCVFVDTYFYPGREGVVLGPLVAIIYLMVRLPFILLLGAYLLFSKRARAIYGCKQCEAKT